MSSQSIIKALFSTTFRIQVAALAVLACSSLRAQAGPSEGPSDGQFIQVDIEFGALDQTETKVILSRYTLIMDGSIPAADLGGELAWYPLYASLALSEYPVDGTQGLNPIVLPAPQSVEVLDDPASFIGLGYNPGLQRFAIAGFFADNELFAITNFDTVGFDETTTFLPSDPAAYVSDTNSYNASAPGAQFVSYEDGLPFTIRVTIVDNPLPEESCPADFNSDGFVDFFDISAFIQAFSEGCE